MSFNITLSSRTKAFSVQPSSWTFQSRPSNYDYGVDRETGTFSVIARCHHKVTGKAICVSYRTCEIMKTVA